MNDSSCIYAKLIATHFCCNGLLFIIVHILIFLTQTSFEIVRYCLVHWEQLSGEAPILSPNKANETGRYQAPIYQVLYIFLCYSATHVGTMSGNLLVKSTNVLGITSWKPGFFELK